MGGYTVPGSVPFVPGVYNSEPGTARIADLILRQGDIAANRQARSGEIWGNTINQVGQIAAQGLQQYQQQKDQRAVGGAISAATSRQYPSATKPAGMPMPSDAYLGQLGMGAVPGDESKNVPAPVADPGSNHLQAILDSVDPRLRPAVMKGIQDFNTAADVADERKARLAKLQQDIQRESMANQQADVDAMGTLAHHIVKNHFLDGPDGGLGAIGSAVTVAKGRGMSWATAWDTELQQAQQAMQQAQQSGDPGRIQAVADSVRQHFGPRLQQLEMSMSEDAQNRIKKNEAPIKGAPGDVFFDPDTKQPVMSVPEKAPNLELKETAQGLQPWNPKTNELGAVIAKGKPPAATIINPAQTDRAKLIADAIESGEQPPDTKGLYRDGPAVKAELAKRHFNLSLAEIDWKATQKHVQTLNGPAQTKLMQSINTLPELLDSVDSLASQWKGGRFPVLNKANLALAKNGAYGSDVASVAVKLDAQIADVTSDLGAVYMGGNTPTDHSLGLAAKALAGEWDEKVLHSMVDLARGNVQIRKNSILNTGVAGASAGNVYAPATQAPAAPAVPSPTAKGAVTVTAPNGKVYTFPNQGEADAFRKRAGISG